MQRTPPPDDRTVHLVAEQYSSDADVYEKSWAPVLRPHSRRLLDRLPLAKATRVLDAGAGVGTLLVDIQQAAPAATVVGIDCALGMLSRAPEIFPRALMDVGHLGFSPETFDAVVMAFMLFHVQSPFEALREARRVLRPGGAIGAITWDGEPRFRAQKILQEELQAAGAVETAASPTNHEPVGSPAKMRALLESAAFERIEIWEAPLDHQYDMEGFIKLRTTRGGTRRLFETLEPPRRNKFLHRLNKRLAKLSPPDFVDGSMMIFATAIRR